MPEVKVLQANYGYGWDDLVTYSKPYNYEEIKSDYDAYAGNENSYPHRIITRRIKKED